MNTNTKTKNLIYCGLFASLITICSWIAIPAAVPFTLQTFAVFLTILVSGPKWSSVTVTVYIVLGMAGLPVFAGFQSGIGVIAGPLGGYLLGFIFTCLLSGVLISKTKNSKVKTYLFLSAGLIVCYIFGTLWYLFLYTSPNENTFIGLLSICVIPFIVPDIVKMIIAVTIYDRIKKHI